MCLCLSGTVVKHGVLLQWCKRKKTRLLVYFLTSTSSRSICKQMLLGFERLYFYTALMNCAWSGIIVSRVLELKTWTVASCWAKLRTFGKSETGLRLLRPELKSHTETTTPGKPCECSLQFVCLAVVLKSSLKLNSWIKFRCTNVNASDKSVVFSHTRHIWCTSKQHWLAAASRADLDLWPLQQKVTEFK